MLQLVSFPDMSAPIETIFNKITKYNNVIAKDNFRLKYNIILPED